MTRDKNQPRFTIPSVLFTWLLALFFAGALNIPFITALYQALMHSGKLPLGFVISIPLLFIALFNILLTPLSVKGIEKFIFSLLLITSSIVGYASYNYGIIFDTDMINNILLTYYGETLSYFSPALFAWVIGLGIIPSLLIYKVRIIHPRWFKDLSYKLLSVLLSLLIIAIAVSVYYKEYTYVGRENNHLRRLIIPTYFVYSTYKRLHSNYINQSITHEAVAIDAKQIKPAPATKHTLLVLVVGEAARSMNYQLNGYARPTNQYTRELGVISLQHVRSCGTATATSVPCMFTRLSHADFNIDRAQHQDHLLAILQRAGLNTLWLDNDGGCKGMCNGIQTIEANPATKPWCDGTVCVDEVLLDDLDKRIQALRGKDSVIVLHIIGSHGPAYFQRFPAKHNYFKPNCTRIDIQNCSLPTIQNSYDNSILYSDFVLSRLIHILTAQQNDWQTALMYVSDHGESLGENGIYLHGLPYAVAPIQQTQIPWFIWLSAPLAAQKGIDKACLQEAAHTDTFSHDNLFHSVLGLLDISTKDYNPPLDLFAACRKPITP